MNYEKVDKAYKMLSKISNRPMCKKVLELLVKDGPMTCEAIAATLRDEYTNTSQYIWLLAEANLITREKEGKYTYYAANIDEIMRINGITAKLNEPAPYTIKIKKQYI